MNQILTVSGVLLGLCSMANAQSSKGPSPKAPDGATVSSWKRYGGSLDYVSPMRYVSEESSASPAPNTLPRVTFGKIRVQGVPQMSGDSLKALPAPKVPFYLNLTVHEFTDDDLKQFARFETLEALSLTAPFCTDEQLERLADIKRLKHLKLIGCRTTGKCLKSLVGKASLVSLEVNSNQQSEEDLKFLADFTELKELILNTGHLQLDFELIAKMENLESFATEIVSNIRDVREVAKMKGLQSLSLSAYEAFTDDAAKELGTMPKLKALTLTKAKFTTEAYEALGHSKSIQTLVLIESSVSDEDLEAIAKMPGLKKVVLRKTKVTKAGIATQKKKTPSVQFELQ